MAHCWKEEFEVLDNDGNDVDWFDDFHDAVALAETIDGAMVVRLRHYQSEYDTVWPGSSDE